MQLLTMVYKNTGTCGEKFNHILLCTTENYELIGNKKFKQIEENLSENLSLYTVKNSPTNIYANEILRI